MSITRIQSFAFAGIEAQPVEVQVQIAAGLPVFLVVGLADKAVAESRERVRAALTAMGLALPAKRILVNLAPADLQKEGSHFDLPIALGVLTAMDVLPAEEMARFAAIGELSLDGRLAPVAGVLPAAIAAGARDLGLICPAAQGPEAGWAGEIGVLAPADLLALINHFRGEALLEPPPRGRFQAPSRQPDLADVRGMDGARRALEIAAAGQHNLLMIGAPGGGKSMLAARLPGLLPDLTPREALEVSMVHSVAGLLSEGRLVTRPPFREPHHSASMAAIAGGGNRARPGEISLAHRGVLFLDEFPEFPRAALEALRQPLETGRTTVARAAAHVTYPARFLLVAAMNPCPCGEGSSPGRCRCSPASRDRYARRLSAPLLDRFDLRVAVSRPDTYELLGRTGGESSAAVALRVARARELAAGRGVRCNAELSSAALEAVAPLTGAARRLVSKRLSAGAITARGLDRIRRVARTIADLDGAPASVDADHVGAAIELRAERDELTGAGAA